MTKDLDELQEIATRMVKLLQDRQEGTFAWLMMLQKDIADMKSWIDKVTGK